jgi:phosphatidylglycerol---prolipoprotein diacylglyceryl transferase
MPAAFIPSPSRGEWHVGPLPVRGYALCIVLGILLAVWLATGRYRKAGGRPGLILDVAAWAVPFALVAPALHALVAGAARLFPSHPDLWNAARDWTGAIGVPGAVGLGAVGAWIACRRAEVRLGPVAGAAAPGLAFGLALASLGGWFAQKAYGPPTAIPWAVEISPVHRFPGYENFATFQPVFGYEALWCAAVGFAVMWAAQRFALPGERAFMLGLGLTFAGVCALESLLVSPGPQAAGLRAGQWAEILTVIVSTIYLYRTRHRHGPDIIPPVLAPSRETPAGHAHGAAAS